MNFKKRVNPKEMLIFVLLPFIIGWVGTCGGKYDHMSLHLAGYETRSFLVGSSEEEIQVRLNTAGRNWTLDFDDGEEIILVNQDGKAILEGCFLDPEGFLSWGENLLNAEQYTVIKTDSQEIPNSYFCLSNEGIYIFLSKIDNSDWSIMFYTPYDTEITEEKALDTFQRITVTAIHSEY